MLEIDKEEEEEETLSKAGCLTISIWPNLISVFNLQHLTKSYIFVRYCSSIWKFRAKRERLERIKDINLKCKASIWPWRFCLCRGQHPAVTVLYVPISLSSGRCRSHECWHCLFGNDRLRAGGPLWARYHERRRCSRNTYSESYITKYASIRRSQSHFSPSILVYEDLRVTYHRLYRHTKIPESYITKYTSIPTSLRVVQVPEVENLNLAFNHLI